MTNPDENQPTLPGLELGEHRGALREAVVATIEALREDGLLERRHTGMAQLALEMADAVQRGIQSNRASAAAMAAAQLHAALEALPKPLEASTAAKFDALLDELRKTTDAPA